MNLALFASGGLGLTCIRQLHSEGYRITVIFTDNRSKEIAAFAAQNQIPVFAGNPRKGEGLKFLESRKIVLDLVVSINYLFLIEQDLIDYPKIAAINFHGSLLPQYRGRTPHVWAIINNEKYTGISAHFIVEACDEGPVIDQLKIEIKPDDTGGTLLSQFNQLYPGFVKKTIERFKTQNVIGTPQDQTKASFFGKRTPDDGKIEWSWQRERIYNWVRAQADPYPGAFCFYKNQKIVIDKIEFSTTGFTFADPDGVILEGGRTPVVKTPDGAVKILKMRTEINFEKGDCLQ